MYVKTEPIVFLPATDAEKEKLSRILREYYGYTVQPQNIERFAEKTAASNVYRCFAESQRVVIKESFWYHHIAKNESEQPVRALKKAYEISEILRINNVPLPRVLPNLDGNFITTANATQIIALEYIEGEHFSSRDSEFTTSGDALARFHSAGNAYLQRFPRAIKEITEAIPVEKPYEESRMMYDADLRSDLLAPHECSVPEICAAVREHIRVIDGVIQTIDDAQLTSLSLASGIVHNDFHINNALFNTKGEFVAFLDIDQVGIAPYVWDIGNTLCSFASNFLSSHPREAFEEKVRLFLNAYHSVFPLPLNEYLLCVPAMQRWDVMRILRSLRRHHYENDRLPTLFPKIKDRLLERIVAVPKIFSFLTIDWLDRILR